MGTPAPGFLTSIVVEIVFGLTVTGAFVLALSTCRVVLVWAGSYFAELAGVNAAATGVPPAAGAVIGSLATPAEIGTGSPAFEPGDLELDQCRWVRHGCSGRVSPMR